MKLPVAALLALALLLPATLLAGPGAPSALSSDHALLDALANSDKPALEKLLDSDFTWTDSTGKIFTRAEVLEAPPQPGLGRETDLQPVERVYGDVAGITAGRGKIHVLRIWVNRADGWRLLVYHEVAQLDEPNPSPGTGVHDCENPCKRVPYTPRNDAERAIIASWQALETGVTNHDSAAWAPHIAEEFVQVSSASDHPINKAGRIATLDKQKKLGVGSAPSPLVSARMYDFAEASVMSCLHETAIGKHVRVTRLWVLQNGQWVISISYQTGVKEAAPKTP